MGVYYSNMAQNTTIQAGNAATHATHGWFVGASISESLGLRHTSDVELKWSAVKKDDAHPSWVIETARTTVAILISGKYEILFRDQAKILAKQGDFVMWGKDRDHRGRALEDSVVLTVRWPSIPSR